MKKITQKEIAKKIGVSDAMISQFLRGHKNISAATAKKLAEVTGTSPLLWLYGSLDEIKSAITQFQEGGDNDKGTGMASTELA